MRKLLQLCAAFALLFSSASFASNLPDALLKLPIHFIDGTQETLADYQGKKPVYLKMWATWCQPCREQMPHFEHVQQEYGNDIEVIALNLGLNDDLDSIKDTIKEFGLTMPMAIDQNGELAQNFRLIGTPYHLVFDKDMNLVHTGHDADSTLDSTLALVAQRKVATIINSNVLVENEADIPVNLNDGKLHGLYFTATWCDWYWEETRPEASKMCVQGQKVMNKITAQQSNVAWLGVINRLWTGDSDKQEYVEKFSVKHATEVDKSNGLFHQFNISELPVLLFVKNGKVVGQTTDFYDEKALANLVEKLN